MSTAFNPPVKIKRVLSPWAWAGVGCAGLSVLLLICTIMFGIAFYSNYKKPYDRSAVLSVIGDLPLYSDSVVDDEQTHLSSSSVATTSFLIPSGSTAALALSCTAPTSKIIDYYDREMIAQGWQRLGKRESIGLNQQYQYSRNKDLVFVQVQDSAKGDSKTIILMRFRDLKK
jgi:hypothetical protein